MSGPFKIFITECKIFDICWRSVITLLIYFYDSLKGNLGKIVFKNISIK